MPANLIVTIIGLVFIANGVWAIIVRQRAKVWLIAKGEITKSEVRGNFWRQYSEDFRVAYRFLIDKEEYFGSNVTPGGLDTSWSISFPGFSSARGKKTKYPVGAEVSVYYDPNNPKSCSLEQPGLFLPVVIIFIGAGVLGISVHNFLFP